MSQPLIRRASTGDVGIAARLFDSYRQFYEQPADYQLAESFLRERLTNNESVIFLAVDPESGDGLGFMQLYPSFSSVSARRIWILNDLFVVPTSRQRGVGRALLDAARDHAISTNAKRLVLSTAKTNSIAQALYKSYGYQPDEAFLEFTLEL